MKTSHIAVASVAALLFTQTGCGSSVKDACLERARAECKYAFSCCEDAERIAKSVTDSYVTSEQECVDRGNTFCSVGYISRSAELGRTAVDIAAQDDCLSKINRAAEGCDIEEFLVAQQLCGDLVVPLVDDGDECAYSDECKSGTCNIERDENLNDDIYNAEIGAPKGDCLATLAVGEECVNQVCADGFYCAADGCQANLVAGDDCGAAFDACADGLECVDSECRVIDVDLDVKYCTGRQ